MACDFQTKSIGNDGIGSIWLDRIEINDFTINKTEKDRDQALESGPNGDKYKCEREDMSLSRSSISKSERLRRKFRFQEKGSVDSRTDEIVGFLTVIILNRPEN